MSAFQGADVPQGGPPDSEGLERRTQFPSAPAASGMWRLGSKYRVHVYEVLAGGDRPVATFVRPEDAAEAVEAHNWLVGGGAR